MKKNNPTTRFAVVMMIFTLFISCGKKSTEYAQVIPANASGVMSIDFKSLIKKSGLADNKELTGNLSDALKEGLDQETAQYMEQILKNPSESGISIDDNFYFFFTDEERITFAAKVNNASRLKKTLEMLSEEGLTVEYIPSSYNYEILLVNQEYILCFDNDKVIGTTAKYASENKSSSLVEAIMNTSRDSSAVSQEWFTKLIQPAGDIHTYFDMSVFPKEYARMIQPNLPEGVALKDMAVISHLSFENGKIAITSENYTTNEQVKEMNQLSAKASSPVNTGFMEYFPAASLYYLTANIDGAKLSELMSTRSEYEKMFDEMERQGVDMLAILESINGDFAISLTSLSDIGMPSFGVYAHVKDNALLDMFNNVVGSMASSIGDNSYKYTVVPGLSVYYGIKDNVFYISTEENSLGKQQSPVSKTKWSSSVKGSYTYMMINIKEITNLALYEQMLGYEQQAMIVRTALAQFDYVEMVVESPQKFVVNFVMSNQDANSLSQLVSLGQLFAN